MKNKWIILVGLFFVAVVGGVALVMTPAPQKNGGTQKAPAEIPDLITVTSPLPDSYITFPLTITGKARGSWYFEASAPVEIIDDQGAPISLGHIEAEGDWMTSEYVPFRAILYQTPINYLPEHKKSTKGTLILRNDNPSGLPENEKKLEIPVVF